MGMHCVVHPHMFFENKLKFMQQKDFFFTLIYIRRHIKKAE